MPCAEDGTWPRSVTRLANTLKLRGCSCSARCTHALSHRSASALHHLPRSIPALHERATTVAWAVAQRHATVVSEAGSQKVTPLLIVAPNVRSMLLCLPFSCRGPIVACVVPQYLAEACTCNKALQGHPYLPN
jgi:hypothetical protein